MPGRSLRRSLESKTMRDVGSLTKVLVIGGGVGGMSAAISLRRQGLAVDLIEIDPEWRALGAGLTLNGATMQALRTLGLLEQVVTEGFAAEGTGRMCDASGNLLFNSNRERPFGPDIPVSGGILRPILHRIMQEAVRESGAEIRLGVGFKSLTQTDAATEVTFDDDSRASYDLVVAADGLFSQVRDVVFPDAKPRFTGQGCWRALVDRPTDIDTSFVYVGPRHKVGFNPVSDTQMYLFLLQHVPDNRWMPQEDWRALLQEQMEEFGGLVGEIRDQLDESNQINYRPLEYILLPAPWHSGRVLLIGDAAHATTPHSAYGAGLAMEDGVILGELLADGQSLEHTLRLFMDRRYERCRAIVEGSIALGDLEMQRSDPAAQREAFKSLLQVIQTPA